MTRTNKWTVHEARGEPKWFTHHGPINADPTKTKKEGAGNHNWGRPGDELNEQFSFFGQSGRRNSNHQENEERMTDLNNKLEDDLMM